MMGHIVVCGLGRFGLTIVEALRSAQRGVTVITDARTNQDRIDRATAAGATIVAGDFRCAGARHAANVHGAAPKRLPPGNQAFLGGARSAWYSAIWAKRPKTAESAVNSVENPAPLLT